MKKIALFGGVAALLGICAAALPYYVGTKVEENLRADHELMSQELLLPGLTIALADYQRGWLSANATTAITFKPEGAGSEAFTMEIRHTISHLPDLGQGAIASVVSELVLPAKWKSEADRILQGQSPLTSVSYVGFSGNEWGTINSPAFKTTLEDGAVTIDWKGLQGSVSETRDNSHITGNVTMPGLVVSSAPFNFSLTGITYDVDMVRGSYDMWFGKSNAGLKSLQFNSSEAGGSNQILVSNIRITTDQKERDEVTDGSGIVQVGKSSFDDFTLDSAVYDFEFRNIDTKTLSDIQNLMRQSYTGGDPTQMGGALLNAIPALLNAKPEINIRRLEMKSSLGNFNGKLHLAFVGEWNDAMMGNPLAVIPLLTADLELALSKELLQTIAKSQMRSSVVALAQMQGEELSEEELEQMASERTSQQLEMMEANGYIEQKDGSYATKIQFEKGQLTINGKAANEFFGRAQ